MPRMMRIPNTDAYEPNTIRSYAEQRRQEMKGAFEECAKNIMKRQVRSKRNFNDRRVFRPITSFNKADMVLIVKQVTQNKIDDHYDNEVFEITERRGDSHVYIVRGIIKYNVSKQVHRDNIIPFKQACTDTQPAIPIDVQVDQPQSIKRIPKVSRLKKYDTPNNEEPSSDTENSIIIDIQPFVNPQVDNVITSSDDNGTVACSSPIQENNTKEDTSSPPDDSSDEDNNESPRYYMTPSTSTIRRLLHCITNLNTLL